MATYSTNTTIKLGSTFTSATQNVSRATGTVGISTGGNLIITGGTDGGWVFAKFMPTNITTTAGGGNLILEAGLIVNGTYEHPLWIIRNTATANVVTITTANGIGSTTYASGQGSIVSDMFRIGVSTSLTPYIRNFTALGTTVAGNFSLFLAIESNTP